MNAEVEPSRGCGPAFYVKLGLVSGAVRCLWSLCRIDRIQGESYLLDAIRDRNPVILCYWHQGHILCLKYLLGLKQRRADFALSALVSPSRDGDLAAAGLRRWNVEVVRGSSTRTGAKAMRDLYGIVKRGYSPVITPDGPQGPPFEFKRGAVALAQLTGAPMLPVAYAIDRAALLNSWDRTAIPKPFAKITITIGEPVVVDKNASREELDAYARRMESLLPPVP